MNRWYNFSKSCSNETWRVKQYRVNYVEQKLLEAQEDFEIVKGSTNQFD